MSEPSQESPRHHTRQRTLKSARIVFNNSASSFDVVVRDISESGAKLKLSAQGCLAPDMFDLLILNPNTGTATRHHCEKRWQRGDLVGARFLVNGEDKTPAPRATSALQRNIAQR